MFKLVDGLKGIILVVLSVIGSLGIVQESLANEALAQKARQTSCAVCHISSTGALQPSLDTLNDNGKLYLNCRLNQACYDSVTAQIGTPSPQPTPQYQPAPQPTPQYQPQYQQPPQPTPQYQPQYQPPPQPTPQYQTVPPSGSEIPGGSYLSFCRDVEVSRNNANLFATCAAPGGGALHTVLRNFRDCQSDIYVDVGYLRCQLRGGGLNRAYRWINVYNDQSLLQIDSVKLKTASESNWTEYLQQPIKAHEHRTIFLDASLSCKLRIRLGVLWQKHKDDMDTCTFSRFRERNRDYVIE